MIAFSRLEFTFTKSVTLQLGQFYFDPLSQYVLAFPIALASQTV